MNGITEILDGFNSSSLVAFKAMADEMYLAGDSNPYLEPVDIPPYTGLSDQCLIGTDGDWNNNTLNGVTNPLWKHFYVPAGDYTTVTLTADGTDGDRRTISLYNENDLHPGKLLKSEQAHAKMVFSNASYWTIDRMSAVDIVGTYDDKIYDLEGGSSFNVFNRLNIDNFNRAWIVYNLCHNNTLQNSRIVNQDLYSRQQDQPATGMATAGINNVQVHNTKFIENEMMNTLDSIQLIIVNVTGTNYEGTIIDSNRMWQTSDIYYSDGFGTTLDPNGLYSWSENAMDFKACSDDPANPVIVTNNIMWGWRKQCDDDGGGDPGACIAMHEPLNNFIIDNNIMFDSYSAIESVATSNSISIRNNIIYECDVQPPDFERAATYMYYAHGQEFEYNTYVNNTRPNTYSTYLANLEAGATMKNNLYVTNSHAATSNNTSVIEVADNYFYDTVDNTVGATGNVDGGVASNANMTDLTITYDNFTTSPKSHTLTGVISTPSSPHYGVAGSDIT